MAKDNISFEQALEQLEDIVAQLEDPKNTMAHSMELFQQGVELAKICEAELTEYEGKISLLIEAENKELKEEEFDA